MMRKLPVLLLLCAFAITCTAQTAFTLKNKNYEVIENAGVLRDSGYSFERILHDSSLVFDSSLQLRPASPGIYWIKCIVYNPSKYAVNYNLYFHPYLDNSFFLYDDDQKKWVESRTGLLLQDGPGSSRLIPSKFQGDAQNILFIKTNISALDKAGNVPAKWLRIEKETATQKRESTKWIVYTATMLVMFIFLLYNGLIYFNTRDKVYLYYLISQLGGIIYLTCYFSLISIFIGNIAVSVDVAANGQIYYYDLNSFVNRFGTVIMLFGFVQLARHFLNTRTTLPFFDKALKYLIILDIAFELVMNLATISKIQFTSSLEISISNGLVVLVVVSVLATAVVAHFRKVRGASYFLLADAVTLIIVASLAVYFIVFEGSGKGPVFFPCIAALAHAGMFAFALVERLRIIKKEVDAKQEEAEKLKTDITKMQDDLAKKMEEKDAILNEISLEKNKNEALENKLAAHQRELASASLYMSQKNELLSQLKFQIQDLGKLLPHGHTALKRIESNLQHNRYLDDDWEKFRLHFEQVHPRFFENLLQKHPGLTQYEIRLCAYFHMNLSTKEIAGLLNIDPASVRRAKTRLNKKMNLALPVDNIEKD